MISEQALTGRKPVKSDRIKLRDGKRAHLLDQMAALGAYERMRAVRPDVKVLFTTGYAPASTRLSELLVTDDAPILEKPFTPLALAASVRRAIDAPKRGRP